MFLRAKHNEKSFQLGPFLMGKPQCAQSHDTSSRRERGAVVSEGGTTGVTAGDWF